jgi:fluoride ion exporter CrcB/FEX
MRHFQSKQLSLSHRDAFWRALSVSGTMTLITELGGYTTSSSFEWETYSVIRERALWMAGCA